MKICAIICEYNPFHNGHLHHIQEAKARSGADAILCVMSGNFVQRGEAAILEKGIRAKHAILAGADAVIELPTVFASANAELFAKGAIHLLSAIPEVTCLCFGAENAEKEDFLRAAQILNDEPQEVSQTIKRLTAEGASYAKARAEAFAPYLPENILTKPNNLLGVEYARAILAKNCKIEILPIPRLGANYLDEQTQENFSSATAIRGAIERQDKKTLQSNLPSYVFEDLPFAKKIDLSPLEKYAILRNGLAEIAAVCDCSEGLENAFKRAAKNNVSSFEKELTSARYTSARIRRIALHNLLAIDEKLIRKGLSSPLYLRLLAADKKNEKLLSALGKAEFPLIVKNADGKKLTGVAKEIFEKENFADEIYCIASGLPPVTHNPFV